MARPTTEERLAEVHREARAEFDDIQAAQRTEREQCLQDRRFCTIPGAQWEGDLESQFANKPRLEVNKVRQSVIRIFNEYRNNRISVSFVSKDGSPNDELADACAALYRADEKDSSATEAYDNAFDEAVSGGIGAWRLRAKYEDEESEEDERQRICIEPIFDADSCVFFDLDAKRQDKSDARSCYVLTSMTRDEYKRRFDDDPTTWPKDIRQSHFDWATDNCVYIAELYRVEETRDTILFFKSPVGGEEVSHAKSELDEDPDLARDLEVTGFTLDREKNIKRRRVHKYLLSGGRVLEDCGYIAGNQIPIVVTYGTRWFIDNVERCMGHVRLAKDAQRLKNMQLSKLAEISALSPVAKPLLTPAQIAGHTLMWADDNIKNYPYRLWNPVPDANGNDVIPQLQMVTAPDIPQALAALLQLTEQDMRDILGNPEQAEKVLSHVAGKTMEMVAQRVDAQAFIYFDNMSKAIRRSGQIWLPMARQLYVEAKRKMKGLGPRGETTQIELMRPMVDESGRPYAANDLTKAAFDVHVSVGPSSESQRQAAGRMLTELLGFVQDPQLQRNLVLQRLYYTEAEGVGDSRKWARQELVRLGVFEPTAEEARQLAAEAESAPPDPQRAYLLAEAEKAQAQAMKAQADTGLVAAQTEKTQAETAETLAGIDTDAQRAAVETAKSIHEIVTAPARPAPQPPAFAPGK